MDLGARDLIRLVSQKAKLVLLFLILSTCAAIAVTLLAPISYKTTAVVLVKPGRFVESTADSATATSARQEQNINSLVQILGSEEVMRRAIDAFGARRLYPEMDTVKKVGMTSRVWQVRFAFDNWRKGGAFEAPVTPLTTEELFTETSRRASKSLQVGAEPKTDLIWITFSHGDPVIATDFANTVLAAFRQRTIELFGRSGAAAFFTEQKKTYDAAFETTSKRLSDFAAQNDIYNLVDQQKLVLERRNLLLAANVKTKGDIVDKQYQASATATQITNLKPIAQYPQIRDLARSTKKTEDAGTGVMDSLPDIPRTNSATPLLLVRVYQDTVQSLVKLKTEIAGLTALQELQRTELSKIDTELQSLAQRGSKFERLQLEVIQSREASQQYAALATKEQLAAEVNKKGLSTIEIAQSATIPSSPAFPNPAIIIPFGMAGGLALGIALVLFQVAVGSMRSVAPSAHSAPAPAPAMPHPSDKIQPIAAYASSAWSHNRIRAAIVNRQRRSL